MIKEKWLGEVDNLDSITELNRAVDEICFALSIVWKDRPQWVRRFIKDSVDDQIKLLQDPLLKEHPLPIKPKAKTDIEIAVEKLEALKEEFKRVPRVYPCKYEEAFDKAAAPYLDLRSHGNERFAQLPIELRCLMPVENLAMSARPLNGLGAVEICTVGGIIDISPHDLLQLPNIGRRSIIEIVSVMKELGLIEYWADCLRARGEFHEATRLLTRG